MCHIYRMSWCCDNDLLTNRAKTYPYSANAGRIDYHFDINSIGNVDESLQQA